MVTLSSPWPPPRPAYAAPGLRFPGLVSLSSWQLGSPSPPAALPSTAGHDPHGQEPLLIRPPRAAGRGQAGLTVLSRSTDASRRPWAQPGLPRPGQDREREPCGQQAGSHGREAFRDARFCTFAPRWAGRTPQLSSRPASPARASPSTCPPVRGAPRGVLPARSGPFSTNDTALGGGRGVLGHAGAVAPTRWPPGKERGQDAPFSRRGSAELALEEELE